MNFDFNPIYYNTLDQIYHVKWVSTKLARLELLKQSINRLWPKNHPTRLIQVAGTSGKGSVCRFLEAGFSLRATSGSLLSPHLFDYRERFNIQGRPASQDDIIEAWEERIKPLCLESALENENHVHTFSEIYVLMALCLFEKYLVEWAAIETGLGGRYDQTTALEVAASAITNVGSDHEHLLGREQWQRTLDKGGVCRRDTPLFTSAQDEETLGVIEAICRYMNAPFYRVKFKDVENVERLLNELYPSSLPEETLLSSEHQLWNAALSLKIAKHFFPDLDSKEILATFVNVRFQGRFQKVQEGIYVDVAHNPDKINVLAREVRKRFPGKRKVFVIGLAGVRSPKEVFSPLLEITDKIIIASASYKGQPPYVIEQELGAINKRGIPIEIILGPEEALNKAQSIRDKNSVVILTGSTYMIDQALNPDPYIRYINATYGWRNREQTIVS